MVPSSSYGVAVGEAEIARICLQGAVNQSQTLSITSEGARNRVTQRPFGPKLEFVNQPAAPAMGSDVLKGVCLGWESVLSWSAGVENGFEGITVVGTSLLEACR